MSELMKKIEDAVVQINFELMVPRILYLNHNSVHELRIAFRSMNLDSGFTSLDSIEIYGHTIEIRALEVKETGVSEDYIIAYKIDGDIVIERQFFSLITMELIAKENCLENYVPYKPKPKIVAFVDPIDSASKDDIHVVITTMSIINGYSKTIANYQIRTDEDFQKAIQQMREYFFIDETKPA